MRTPFNAHGIAAVLFDVGGVLMVPRIEESAETDVAQAFARFFQEVFLEQYHRTHSDHLWHQLEIGTISEREFFDALAIEFGQRSGCVISGTAARAATWGSGMEVNYPMLDLVVDLRAIGKKTGIISNAGRGALDHVEQFHDESLFDTVIISGDVGVRKPNPDIYLLAAEALSVEPQACMFIDDIAHNLDAAIALGFHTILCSEPLSVIAELRNAFQLPVAGVKV